MLLIIEPNKTIRKRLCDLLSRERILGVDSYSSTLEMFAKFRNNINIIIANIRLLKDILLRGTLYRLCDKLYINKPPILALYKKGDEKIKEEFKKNNLSCKLIKYDGEDNSFPDRYITAVKKLYPDVVADLQKARDSWLRGEEIQTPFDAHAWLIKEGFLESIKGSKINKIAEDMEEVLPLIKKLLEAANPAKEEFFNEPKQDMNYEKMYGELKQKYDLLVKYIRQLARSTKTS